MTAPVHSAHARIFSANALQRRRRPQRWSEIAVTSHASFLRGASHPEELVARAIELGYAGMALVDHATVGGAVRAHVARSSILKQQSTMVSGIPRSEARDALQLGFGARVCLSMESSQVSTSRRGHPYEHRYKSGGRDFVKRSHKPIELMLYATDRASWGLLSLLLTRMRSHVIPHEDANENPHENRLQHTCEEICEQTSASRARAVQWQRYGSTHLSELVELLRHHQGGGSVLAVIVPPSLPEQRFLEAAEGLARMIPDRIAVALSRTEEPESVILSERACVLASALGIPVAATGDVRMHDIERRQLLDVLTAIRFGTDVRSMQHGRHPRTAVNAERRMRSVQEMLLRFADKPEAVETSVRFVERASHFSLDQLRYEYPDEVSPQGVPPMRHLHELVWKGARERYPRGVPAKVARQFEHEFAIIEDLQYAPYFLTVHEIVAFARSRGILCQGRGAAANSAVCFALGITAVDPDRIDVLFERFVSRERNEPPDIDIDFEHERREEVIQHIYAKYGRHRAALVCEIISYRGRSAVRDVGKALGFSEDSIVKLASCADRWSAEVFPTVETHTTSEHAATGINSESAALFRAAGVDPNSVAARHFVRLVREIQGFPRHRSQHVGGFVISRGPLAEMVPMENAAMENRTILEWDKDDIEALGMLKIDILSLGMLTAIRKTIDLINGDRHALAAGACSEATLTTDGLPASDASLPASLPETEATAIQSVVPLRFHTIPAEDTLTYDMVCKADTVGVFQIESRAQMSMLPRLKPRCFYDLVIEVAIVRPGPIQGDMVHPYLRRRSGEERAEYPDDAVRQVLAKTLGVPLFQEQAMALAVVAAGFSPGEADHLRRAIAAWKRSGNQIVQFGEKLEQGMVSRGYSRQFALQVFEQIKGFSGYGFPESHAASFALLVYASAWLKRHHPAAFAAALLNSQPMGFYAPAQIVRDAKDHGVVVRGVDIHHSLWDTTLERGEFERGEFERGEFEREKGGFVRIDAGLQAMMNAVRSGTCAQGASLVERWSTQAMQSTQSMPSARWHRWIVSGVAQSNRHAAVEAQCRTHHGEFRLEHRHSQGRSMTPSLTPNGHANRAEPEPLCTPWQCTGHSTTIDFHVPSQPALRLGMRMVRGLEIDDAQRIVEAVRREGRFTRIRDIFDASGVSQAALRRLAAADAFTSMGLDRQQATWQILALRDIGPTLWSFGVAASSSPEQPAVQTHRQVFSQDDLEPNLPAVSELSSIAKDFDATGVSLQRHPIAVIRPTLKIDPRKTRIVPCRFLQAHRDTQPCGAEHAPRPRIASGKVIAVAGLVLVRQRPSTAKGIVFMTIEDETATANLIFKPKVYERLRSVVRDAVALCVRGKVEQKHGVTHLLVSDAWDLTAQVVAEGEAVVTARQFH